MSSGRPSAGRWRCRSRSVVFTVKLPVQLVALVRAHAAGTGRTISSVVVQALEEFLSRGRRAASAQVSDRSVDSEFVFDRHGAAELSVAYRILVPERRRIDTGEGGRGRESGAVR